MEFKRGPEVECNNCGEHFVIDPQYYNDLGRQVIERGMGPEIGYFWEYEGECDKCDQHISINLTAWEYPVGTLNGSTNECQGCEVTTEAEYNVTLEEDSEEDLD